MQTSAMKVCFQIAECSLSYAKIGKKCKYSKLFLGNLLLAVYFFTSLTHIISHVTTQHPLEIVF